jgi:hypothetical protein
MSYLTQNEIASNQAMQNRVAQAAAREPKEVIGPDPDQWMFNNRRDWASAPGWDAAWESARVNHPDPEEGYDPGMDEGVITDSMILSQIQAMGAA